MTEITFEQFGRKLNAAASAIRNSEAKIVLSGSQTLAKEVAGAYRAATGGDGKLSGTGGARRSSGKAAAVSAKAKNVRRYSDGLYVGLVVPTGPYGLIERTVAPHVIAPFVTSDRRRRQTVGRARRQARAAGTSAVHAARVARAGIDARTAKALLIPNVGYRASVNHPGSRGRSVFSTGVRAGGPVVNETMLAETSRQLLAGYRSGVG